jgi:hypothetical protein
VLGVVSKAPVSEENPLQVLSPVQSAEGEKEARWETVSGQHALGPGALEETEAGAGAQRDHGGFLWTNAVGGYDVAAAELGDGDDPREAFAMLRGTSTRRARRSAAGKYRAGVA